MDDFVQTLLHNALLFVFLAIWIVMACVIVAGLEQVFRRVFPNYNRPDSHNSVSPP